MEVISVAGTGKATVSPLIMLVTLKARLLAVSLRGLSIPDLKASVVSLLQYV